MKGLYITLGITALVTGVTMRIAPKVTPIITTVGLCTSISIGLTNSQKQDADRKQKQFNAEQERLKLERAECKRQSQEMLEQQESLKQQLAKVKQEKNELQLVRVALDQERQQLRQELTAQIQSQLEGQFEDKYERCAAELSRRFLKKESDLEVQFEARQAELEKTLKQQQGELELKESQLDQDRQHLEQMLQETYQERDRLKHWQKQLEEAGANLQNTLQTYQERIWQELEKQAEGFTANLIADRSKPLQEWESDLLAREDQIAKVIDNFKYQWQHQFDEQEKQYQQWAESVTEDYNSRVANAHQFYKNFYLSATNEAFTELHDLKESILPPPDVYEEFPTVGLIAERVLRFLHDKQIYADYSGCYEDREGVALLIKPKKRLSFVDDYHAVGKLLPALQTLAPNCNAPPGYKVYDGFRIDFDTSGATVQHQQTRARTKTIDEADPNWLIEIARYCFHFRVNGETRSGKSTFVNNLIGVLKQIWGDDIEIILIDPKYPNPGSKWSIKPKYKRLEGAIRGLKEMSEEIEKRLDLACEDADAGREIREFKPILYVLDEVDMVVGHYNDPTPVVAEFLESLGLATKKSVTDLLKKGLKVGAALKVMVCYIGQSPLCSDLGMRRNDFNHSANFFLGENIPTAIEEIALKHKQAYLRQQYRLRLERYEKIKVVDREEAKEYKYYCMVKVPGESPYLASLPPEGYYDVPRVFYDLESGSGKELEDYLAAQSLKLPSCDSLNPQNPDDINVFKVKLEETLRHNQHPVESDSQTTQKEEGRPNWHTEANPVDLVNAYQQEIIDLVKGGMSKPFQIAKEIWGDVVDQRSRPYAGKKGVKFLIEQIVKRGSN